jgi:hypothetical protein
MFFPDDLWSIIKDFQLDYKKYHKIKMKPILKVIKCDSLHEMYERWTSFPPWPNTNDIIEEQYPGPIENWQIARPTTISSYIIANRS